MEIGVLALLCGAIAIYYCETERGRRFGFGLVAATCALWIILAPNTFEPAWLWWWDRLLGNLAMPLAVMGAAWLAYSTQRPQEHPHWADRDALAPVPFGPYTAWFAVKGADPESVVRALKLRDVERASFQCGTAVSAPPRFRPAGAHVFVTPTIDGWVLAHAHHFFRLAEAGAAQVGEQVATLSAELNAPVQFFCEAKGGRAGAWARAENGAVIRAVLEAGGHAPAPVGEATAEERELGFVPPAHAPAGHAGGEHDAHEEPHLPRGHHVTELAARWSVDPRKLGEKRQAMERGWLGRVDAAAAPARAHH